MAKRLKNTSNIGEMSSDEDSDNLLVERHGLTLYFYADVNIRTALKLTILLRDAELEAMRLHAQYGVKLPIILRIQSDGGSCLQAFGIVDTIRSLRVPVVSVIEGCAASAATLIAVAATKRYATRHSCLLLHQLSSEIIGKAKEIEDEIANVRRCTTAVQEIYTSYTRLSEDDVKAELDNEKWLTADEALQKGIIDVIGSCGDSEDTRCPTCSTMQIR